ncbi:MAG: ribonuclease H family protein [Ruthenibacterium sp.]
MNNLVVYTDASLDAKGRSGISVLFCEQSGKLVGAKGKKIKARDIQDAELSAILFALESIPHTTKRAVIFNDNSSAVIAISKKNSCLYRPSPIVCTIKKLIAAHPCDISVEWIPREKNSIADAIAVMAVTGAPISVPRGANPLDNLNLNN